MLDNSEWGPRAWQRMESIIAEIPCESCRVDGRALLDAMHDLVNLRLNKRAHKQADFLKVADAYSEAAKILRAYSEQLRCPKAR